MGSLAGDLSRARPSSGVLGVGGREVGDCSRETATSAPASGIGISTAGADVREDSMARCRLVGKNVSQMFMERRSVGVRTLKVFYGSEAVTESW